MSRGNGDSGGVGGMSHPLLIDLQTTPPPSRSVAETLRIAGKRAFDLIGSGALILLLSPALAYIAYLVRQQDGGPIFYRQLRHGRNGAQFKIFKFRTMTVDASGQGFRQCRQDDVRVTPLGQTLRRTSLDELPQLFNVFTGSMSLVGPRPHAIDHDFQCCHAIEHYWRRYAVSPGMTGLAQVRGLRGSTQDMALMSARVAADLEYVRRASLWLDMSILFRTASVVLRGQNAF